MYFFLHQKNAASGSTDFSRIICTCQLHETDYISEDEHSPADNSSIQKALENLRGEREFYRLELISNGQIVEVYPIQTQNLYLFSKTNGLNVSVAEHAVGAIATLYLEHPGVSVSSSGNVWVNGNPLAERMILRDGDTLTFGENLDQRLSFREPDWLTSMCAETRRLYVELLDSPNRSALGENHDSNLSSTTPSETRAAQTSTISVATASPSLLFPLVLLILTAFISAASVYFILHLLSI